MATTAPSTVYLQIELSDNPYATLGITLHATEVEVRGKYLELALVVHPDKAPNDKLRELHTSLFQKVESAYNEICKKFHHEEEDNDGEKIATTKRLPETLASLHARNIAFKETLRKERERVLNAKRIFDAQNAVKQAAQQAKNERLAAGKQQTQEKEANDKILADAKKATKQRNLKTKRDMRAQRRQPLASLPDTFDAKPEDPLLALELLAISSEQSTTVHDTNDESIGAIATSPSTWEEHEDLLEAASSQTILPAKPQGPLQNKPTSTTAKPLWNPSLDDRLVSHAEISSRWDKALLSGGGRSGSISLFQKKQREHNSSARAQKTALALCEEAYAMLKPALNGNKTFSGLEEEELVWRAFVETEQREEARTERILRVLDGEVRERYLLPEDDGEGEVGVGLLEFSVDEKK